MDLVEILKRPEGKTLEFKRDLSSPDGALKTIVAFANTAGGTLLIGVEDGSRHVRGVTDPLDLEERVASLVSDRIAPRLVPEIEILPWRRTQVLARTRPVNRTYTANPECRKMLAMTSSPEVNHGERESSWGPWSFPAAGAAPPGVLAGADHGVR